MQIAFKLQKETLDLAAALNNGVRPELEDMEDTYFIFKGEDEPPEIKTAVAFWMNHPQEIVTTRMILFTTE